ncbi:MAG: DUF1801 domain-containing protein [Candidatus Hydrogenedentales bacterium]|jgi:uncharacterized protein YdhG (YjbR/CyaY superfamily)
MKKFATIDEYIAAQPNEVQPLLQTLRRTIRKHAPKAEEAIAYGIPTFRLNGNLVHFAACANHIGFYPAPSGIREFRDSLMKYKTSKGAIQLPIEEKLPLSLIGKIVKFRVGENLAKKAR